MDKQRESMRLERLKKTKRELIDMLGGDKPNYIQRTILGNLDKSIEEKQNLLSQA